MTQDILFYVFSILTLLSGVLVVANPVSRNPVTSAMFLVLTILFMAGLYVLLHAFFLAAVQILVYAGAVIVLFLFVIMLLDLKEEQARRMKKISTAIGAVTVLSVFGLMARTLNTLPAPGASGGPGPSLEGLTAPLGNALFRQYLLPFEILSVLLLVAMMGVILLSKKDLR